LNKILNEDKLGNREGALAALSSMIRGESLEMKRNFIDVDGVEFLLQILADEHQKYSIKMINKAMLLLQDLSHYDQYLNFETLQAATDPNFKFSKQVNSKPTTHINVQGHGSKKEESKVSGSGNKGSESLAKYKHCVGKRLIDNKFIQMGKKVMDETKLREYVDVRRCFFNITTDIMNLDVKAYDTQGDFTALQDFIKLLKNENKNYDGLFEPELEMLKEFTNNYKKLHTYK
jgi:hypothetical protein